MDGMNRTQEQVWDDWYNFLMNYADFITVATAEKLCKRTAEVHK